MGEVLNSQIQKYSGFKAELATAETFEEIKNIDKKSVWVAKIAKDEKLAKSEQDEWGCFRNEIKEKLARWLNEKFPHGKDHTSKVTKENLAKMPVSKKESADARLLLEEEELKKEVIEEMKNSDVVVEPRKVAINIRKKKKEKEREKRKEEYKRISKKFNDDDVLLKEEDFRSINIPDDSIDLILTDPPYPKEFLGLWGDLFRIAERILKQNSFLIAYSGQMYLDEIFKMASEYKLNYYWMFSIEFTKKPLIHSRNIINEWKPILVFQKGIKKIDDIAADKIRMDYTERDLHNKNWGQTIQPFEFLIEHFSKPNDLIFEPFAGSGTTLIACKNKKRRCIATEINKEYIDLIKGRLSER
jgi:site-specific DNA-methyltransferase (adenine-specific)